MRAVEEEADGAAAGGGVVDHFGYEGVVGAEVELVADADLAGGVDNDVPEAHVLVEFAEEEHLDACTGFFLLAVEEGGEDLGVVGDDDIVLFDIVDEVFENAVFHLTGVTVEDEQACLVAVARGFFSYEFFWQVESELG